MSGAATVDEEPTASVDNASTAAVAEQSATLDLETSVPRNEADAAASSTTTIPDTTTTTELKPTVLGPTATERVEVGAVESVLPVPVGNGFRPPSVNGLVPTEDGFVALSSVFEPSASGSNFRLIALLTSDGLSWVEIPAIYPASEGISPYGRVVGRNGNYAWLAQRVTAIQRDGGTSVEYGPSVVLITQDLQTWSEVEVPDIEPPDGLPATLTYDTRTTSVTAGSSGWIVKQAASLEVNFSEVFNPDGTGDSFLGGIDEADDAGISFRIQLNGSEPSIVVKTWDELGINDDFKALYLDRAGVSRTVTGAWAGGTPSVSDPLKLRTVVAVDDGYFSIGADRELLFSADGLEWVAVERPSEVGELTDLRALPMGVLAVTGGRDEPTLMYRVDARTQTWEELIVDGLPGSGTTTAYAAGGSGDYFVRSGDGAPGDLWLAATDDGGRWLVDDLPDDVEVQPNSFGREGLTATNGSKVLTVEGIAARFYDLGEV